MEIEGLRIKGREGRWKCQEYKPRSKTYRHIVCPDDLPEIMDYDYELRNKKSNLYRCGLNGECQPDLEGKPLKVCQQSCTSSEARDLVALTLGYAPEAALGLPASDQIRAVREITGVTLSARRARLALQGLVNYDLWELYHIEGLEEYVKQQRDWVLVKFTRDFIKVLPIINSNLPFDYRELTEQVREVIRKHGVVVLKALRLVAKIGHTTEELGDVFQYFSGDLSTLVFDELDEGVAMETEERVYNLYKDQMEELFVSVFGEEYDLGDDEELQGAEEPYENSDSE